MLNQSQNWKIRAFFPLLSRAERQTWPAAPAETLGVPQTHSASSACLSSRLSSGLHRPARSAAPRAPGPGHCGERECPPWSPGWCPPHPGTLWREHRLSPDGTAAKEKGFMLNKGQQQHSDRIHCATFAVISNHWKTIHPLLACQCYIYLLTYSKISWSVNQTYLSDDFFPQHWKSFNLPKQMSLLVLNSQRQGFSNMSCVSELHVCWVRYLKKKSCFMIQKQ